MQIKSKWLKSESSIEGQPPFNKSLRYRVPLRPRIDALLFRIGLEINKLAEIIKDLKFKDNEIFQKIIFSVTERNFQYHAVLSSELRYARRMNKVVYMSKIILEDLETKLRGVPDIDYLVPLLSTRVTVVRNIRSCLLLGRTPPHGRNVASLRKCLLEGSARGMPVYCTLQRPGRCQPELENNKAHL